jgi:hypothetical protein
VTNTLAYYSCALVYIEKSFITLMPILKKKILGMNGNTNAHVNGPINLSHLDKILQKREIA